MKVGPAPKDYCPYKKKHEDFLSPGYEAQQDGGHVQARRSSHQNSTMLSPILISDFQPPEL
jgi:hypothetical protein